MSTKFKQVIIWLRDNTKEVFILISILIGTGSAGYTEVSKQELKSSKEDLGLAQGQIIASNTQDIEDLKKELKKEIQKRKEYHP